MTPAVLELPEILEAFKRIRGVHLGRLHVEKKFEEFDEDDSVDFDEFSALMRASAASVCSEKFAEVPEEEFHELLKDSFKRFDADDSGELELEEIIQAFKDAPAEGRLSGPGARHVHAIRRRQHPGALDYEEFADLMRELRKENAKQATKRRPRMDAARRAARPRGGQALSDRLPCRRPAHDLAMAQIRPARRRGGPPQRAKTARCRGGGSRTVTPKPADERGRPSPTEDAGGSSRRAERGGDLRGGRTRNAADAGSAHGVKRPSILGRAA